MCVCVCVSPAVCVCVMSCVYIGKWVCVFIHNGVDMQGRTIIIVKQLSAKSTIHITYKKRY